MPRKLRRQNPKVKAPKARSGLKTSVGTKLQQSKLGSALVKFNRDRKSKVKPAAKPKRRSLMLSFPRLGFLRFLSPRLPGRVFWLRVGGIALLLGIGLLLFRVLLVQFPRSVYDDPDRETSVMTGDSINLLLVVYDESDRYSFIDMLGVLSVDLKEDVPLHFIDLSPDFGLLVNQKQVKIRSVLAQFEAEDGYGMASLMSGVESILGVRIDRYVAFSKDKLTSYLEQTNHAYLTTDEVNDAEAGSFDAGEVVQGQRLVDYLAADGAGVDAQMLRMRAFVSDLLSGQLSLGGFAKMYLQLDTLVWLVETDLTRGEWLSLAFSLVNRLSVDSISIGAKQSVVIDSTLGGYLSPVARQVDAEIGPLLVRSRVAKEQARVEVFNATRTGGLASRMKRLLENQGTNVIRTANSPELSDKNKLYVASPELFPANVALVSEMLRGDVQIIEEPYPLNHTGDLVVVLGGGS
ncbi:LytR C-terminal domain-containing protein [Candidatus Dojkabacteria bacterium]|uniref:LytR C-terminal domain-containing protein n=1 Tax=Candidatus Dojkabacteria bacterium TaxID=2099670 RepID=A0A955I5Q5_9BACT|nr:LytR C-terminal domain-containing protein [Candidatus Dojkabacteria bacterium]